MWNAGRQVLIAGHPRRTPWPNQVNINVNKQTYINMPGPMYYPAGGCCEGGGMSTLGKILMGVGFTSAIAGGILGGLSDGKGDVKTPAEGSGLTPEQQKLLDEQQKAIDELKQQNEALQDQLAELNKEKKAKAKEAQDAAIAQAKAAAQAQQAQQTPPEIGAEKIEEKPTTTTFTVKASKTENGKYKGHTGYNIVAGMYKGPDGKPLTHSEIMDLAREIFKGKPLPTGDISLPNEVTVNGKTYSINPEAKQEDVKMAEYEIVSGNHELFQSGAQKAGEHWVGTIDGKAIDGEYKTEEEAKAAAQKEAEKRAAEQQSS